MINLAALEKALSAVEEVGKGEHSFTIHGTSFTLRVLLPEEEVEVQKYAATALSTGDEEEQHTAMSFMDRFQTSLLSHAIIQLNELDLRHEKFIETGETLPNGQPVKIPKPDALTGLIREWGRHLLTGVFRKYAELLAKVEKDAEAAIVFEPVDLDAEINRLEGRLSELREAQRQQKAGPEKAPFAERVERMADFNLSSDEERKGNLERMETPAEAAPAQETVEEFIPYTPEEPQPRRSAVPQQAAPPPPQRQARPPQEGDEPVDLLPQVQNSFVDPGDTDGLASAVAAENARLAQRRAQSGLPMHNVDPLNPDGSALSAARQAGMGRRPAPHHAARRVDHEVRPQEQLTEALAEAQHTQVGTIGDAPVFRPKTPQVIEQNPGRRHVPGQAALNPKQGGSRNPRFSGDNR
jgi:hypothetical protein